MALKNCVVCNSSFSALGNQKHCNKCREERRPYCAYCKKNRVTKNVNKFCSRSCKHASMRTLPDKICTLCGTSFRTKDMSAKFCSVQCFLISQKTYTTRVCQQCSNIFEPNSSTRTQKYCSYDCAHNARKRRVKKVCRTCKCTFEAHAYRQDTQKYCSKKCFDNGTIGPKNTLGRRKYASKYGPGWDKNRQLARKRDNYTCQHCGKRQTKTGRALDVHHIIPFYSFDYIPGKNDNHEKANVLTNLICLCRSCHRKAELGEIPIQPRLI